MFFLPYVSFYTLPKRPHVMFKQMPDSDFRSHLGMSLLQRFARLAFKSHQKHDCHFSGISCCATVPVPVLFLFVSYALVLRGPTVLASRLR